jgi:putative oxidoreductase
MGRKWTNPSLVNPTLGLNIVRFLLAIIVGIHGLHGLLNPGSINGFGQYLGSLGFPLGVALAWFLCILQVVCSLFLIVNRLVILACTLDIIILATGIMLIHIHEGWFVVGPGRNGVEYSLTLIVCLLSILLAYWPRKNGSG